MINGNIFTPGGPRTDKKIKNNARKKNNIRALKK